MLAQNPSLWSEWRGCVKLCAWETRTRQNAKKENRRRTSSVKANVVMPPRIAIPVPHSTDPEYAERSLPQYERAVEMAGGEPVRIPLDHPPAEVMKLIERCDAVLLPGSKADVDPAKYDAPRAPQTSAADAGRDTVDELLLQDAYNMRKPILGICYGLQILNVYRTGTLIQHIESSISHEAGRKVAVAHTVEVEPGSRLARVVASTVETSDGRKFVIPVNSSHHQAADKAGDGLRVVARSPRDGVIEAIEGTSPDHFVLAVQWHPERSVDEDEPSRAIFRALVKAARARHEKLTAATDLR
jgi:putative glutamine amidotransferase